MSSDPLLLPEIWSDMPKGGASESARSEFAANGRSGLVLIDYAGGNAHSDSPPAVRPLDRAEQALQAGGHVPGPASGPVSGPASATLAKGLSDLTAIVTQAEALLRAQGTLKGDVHFAVERIHDVALALRMRDVNSALCDTLEASVREVGDAVVRHEAAATGALSAAALLGDIMHRIEELMRIVAVGVDPVAGPPTEEATSAADVASTIGTPAPPVLGTRVFVAALASVAFATQTVEDIPLPVARDVEHPLGAPALASQAQVTIDPPPAAAAEASVLSAEEQSTEFPAGPLAYSAPAPMADPLLTAAVDGLAADEALSEGVVSTAAMSGRAISEDAMSEGVTSEGVMSADMMSADVVSVGVVSAGLVSEHAASEGAASADLVSDATIADAGDARAFLDALSDESTIGNETLREALPLAEADDAAPAEQPAAAAAHLQNEINVPAEIVAAESIPAEITAAETVGAETVAADVIGAETIPAETVAADTVPTETVAADTVPTETVAADTASTETVAADAVSTEAVAADMVAAGPANDTDQPIAASPVVEATAVAIPATVGESDPNQLPSSAFVGKGATAAETVIRRPASDPLAAFYGLSEEELIALFS